MRWSVAAIAVVVAACAGAQPMPAPAPAPGPTVGAQTPAARPAWAQHDPQRPQPPVARPVGAVVIPPPADATVLFGGQTLDAWTDAGWRLENGYVEASGRGDLRTKASFGDAQMHVEYAIPANASGEGQSRVNSGVVMMGIYEVQILDSYGNTTYADGQAGALYGQEPPLYNASLPPGEWQSLDIIFRRPRFEGNRARSPARFTVIHNGVVVQESEPLTGPTSHGKRQPYAAHDDRLPLVLQNPEQPIRFRNIWIRELTTE